MAFAVGCSRSALDVASGIGQADGRALPVARTGDASVAGDDTSAVDAFASLPDGSPAPPDDASGLEVCLPDGEVDGSSSDALPALPCLERTTVDCDCMPGFCPAQRIRLSQALERVPQQVCPRVCGYESFTIDENGCVTGFTPQADRMADYACVMRALGNVRFSCTQGAPEPFDVYWSCSIAM